MIASPLSLVFGCSSPLAHPQALPPVPPAAAAAPSSPPDFFPAAPIKPEDKIEPVYRNPKIGKVTLRAHQDAQGRLFGPQVMYQVVDPGGWNLDALEPGQGTIPTENIEAPPNPNAPVVAPARETPPAAAATLLLDPESAARIVITGLMRLEDRAAAEALAQKAGGRAALFDGQAGWLLVPLPEKERPSSIAGSDP